MNTLFKTVTGLSPANDITAGPQENEKSCASRIFLKGVEIMAHIGVYDHEKSARQKIILNVELDVMINPSWQDDNISDVVDYEHILKIINRVADSGHIHLLETFAEQLIQECLAHPLVTKADISIEKPDIFTGVASAGVRISRSR